MTRLGEARNLRQEAARLDDYWSPRIVGRVNDQYVKVARLKGDLTWHKHDDEDELFLVLEGSLRIEYEDHAVDLQDGDFHVVPRGVLHNPVCDRECLIALIETVTTQHTGDRMTARTRSIEEQLGS
ncbi:MAG: cupin domain-containing protein [Woeseiaceae bacterium]|jgi:mannose-6-phosphate isomerase-like protein (cupin superfamily)|nr:cupin domain-containing protein [Woeseiaceae bacterium]